MKTSAENMNNSILQAIDIVLQERIKNLAFDKTIICTIIDDSGKKNGKYYVSDGSTKFYAYSSVDSYNVDEQVRVSIANGDMTQDKYIIGKYIANNDITPISFISPLDSVLSITDNLLEMKPDADPYGLPANSASIYDKIDATIDNGEVCRLIANINIAEKYPHLAGLQSSKIYDTLYIQADFKTLLGNYNITQGTYGLRLDIHTDPSSDPRRIYFTSEDMFGNPYNFTLYSKQQAKFDIATMETITKIDVYFFERSNFKDYAGRVAPDPKSLPQDTTKSYINHILVKNIVVGFGADLYKCTDNTLKLYTNSGTTYRKDNANTWKKDLAISWFNKTPENKYIGFGDGVYDAEYDEKSYLQDNRTRNNLLSQKTDDVHKSEAGLTLSYEIKQIKPQLEQMSTIIQNELCPALTAFAQRAHQMPDIAEFLKDDGLVVKSDKYAKSLKSTAKEMYDNYFKVLKYASQFNPVTPTIGVAEKFELDTTNQQTEIEYASKLSSDFNTFTEWFYDQDSETIFPAIAKAIAEPVDNKDYKAFQSYYDQYAPRIAEIFNKIKGIWETVAEKIIKGTGEEKTYPHEIILSKFLELTTVEDFTAAYPPYDGTYDDTKDANKYSIYWYRKDDKALKSDGIMSAGWRQITKADPEEEEPTEHVNIGLPPADGEHYARAGGNPIKVILDGENNAEERFKVVLFYNHERIESNELVFTNETQLINKDNLNYASALQIVHGEESKDTYQEYGTSNSLINYADKYRKRYLSVNFAKPDGTVDNLQLVGKQIFWYVPTRATMLQYDLTDIKDLSRNGEKDDEGNPIYVNEFINDLQEKGDVPSVERDDHYREGYVCFYKTICKGMTVPEPLSEDATEAEKAVYENLMVQIKEALARDTQFCYRINDYYVPSFSNNIISCEVVTDAKTYSAEKVFSFASYGTSGTDYTLVITPVGRQAAVTPTSGLTLKVMLFNHDNEMIEFSSEPQLSVLCGSASWTKELDAALVEENTYQYYIVSSNDQHQGILQVDVDVPYTNNVNGTATLTAYYPIPWAADEEYYMQGGSMVVYNSSGTNPKYYKDEYDLFTQEYGQDKPAANWRVEYYSNDGQKFTQDWEQIRSSTKEEDKQIREQYKDYELDFNFLPKLKSNKLIPSNFFMDFSSSSVQWIPYVVCKNWSQPILIIQNRYGLPLLNNWDGSLQIDEKNGTILSSMVGAGRKTKENTFEGVLMGDIQKAEGDDGQDEFDYYNKQGLGLYGFNNGAQSFGFCVDGTAFIGKSGRGRIYFDGNSGQIASASYMSTMEATDDAKQNERVTPVFNEDGKVLYYRPNNKTQTGDLIPSAGMVIDLDDGYIEMMGVEEKVEGENKYYYADLLDNYKPGEGREEDNTGDVTPEFSQDEVNEIYPADEKWKEVWERPDPIDPQWPDSSDRNKAQTHIVLDARAKDDKPYFRLTDIRGKDLFYTSDESLFIKSSNYLEAAPFSIENGKFVEDTGGQKSPEGFGMKIDLFQGKIDSYNLRVSSRVFYIDSRKNAHANFVVKEPWFGNNLIYMGKPDVTNEEIKSGIEDGTITSYNQLYTADGQLENGVWVADKWYLKSGNYVPFENFPIKDGLPAFDKNKTPRGMKIDLGTGKIDAYNLKIISKNVLIDSTPDAQAALVVKEPYFGNNVLYMGIPKVSDTIKEQIGKGINSYKDLLDQDGNPINGVWLDEQWYLKSGNFLHWQDKQVGAGMKIDLGCGSIESYNFNLMSSNIVINAKGEGLNNSYFTVLAESKKDSTDKGLFEAFSVKKDGRVTFAETWTVKPGYIYGTMSESGPYTILATPDAQIAMAYDGPYSGDVFLAGGYGFNSAEEMEQGYPFRITAEGKVYAKAGLIGKDLATGQLQIDHAQTVSGDGTSSFSGNSLYFMRTTKEKGNDSLCLTTISGGIANNNFYLGPGGLIMRPETPGQYSGVRLTGSGIQIEGCRNSASYGHRAYYSGDGIEFYKNSNIFSDTPGESAGALELQSTNNILLKSNANLILAPGTGEAYAIKMQGRTEIDKLTKLNNTTIVDTGMNSLLELLSNKNASDTVTVITGVTLKETPGTDTDTVSFTIDGKTYTDTVRIYDYRYSLTVDSTKTITVSNGQIIKME